LNDLCGQQDICGIICAIMTWMLIFYAEFVVVYVMLLPSPYPIYSTINLIIFQLFAFLAFASHLRTMFTDPVSFTHGDTAHKERTTFSPPCLLYQFSPCVCRGRCQKETPPKR
jgi:hypothetical protein